MPRKKAPTIYDNFADLASNPALNPKAMLVNIERAFKRIEALEKGISVLSEPKQSPIPQVQLGAYLVTYEALGRVKNKVVESYGYTTSRDGTMVDFDPDSKAFSVSKHRVISIELLDD